MSLISRKLLSPRIQELGKIKLGGKGPEVKSSGGKTFQRPVKFTHFVVTTRERGDDGNFTRDDAIHATVGAEPKELEAILMFETPEQNFHAEMVVYEGRTKVWSCNGEKATNLKNGKCAACPRLEDKACKCKPYSRLHLQLFASPTLEGYHVFRTTSWESTNNIQTTLERLYHHFGTLMGLPVKLVCYPATVTYEQGGKSKTSKAMMAGLVLGMSFEEASRALISRAQVHQITKSEVKKLAAQVESSLVAADEEEAEDISVEFFPDESGAASTETQATLDQMKQELGVIASADDDEAGDDPDFEIVDEVEEDEAEEEEEEEETNEESEPAPAKPDSTRPGPASASELVRLMKLREAARGAGDGLTVEDEEQIEGVLKGKNGPDVRMWIDTLEGMVPAGAGATQGDLLDQED